MILSPSDSNLMLCPCTCRAQPGYWSASSDWVTKRILGIFFLVFLWGYKLLLPWTLSTRPFFLILFVSYTHQDLLSQLAAPLHIYVFQQVLRLLQWFYWPYAILMASWKPSTKPKSTTVTLNTLSRCLKPPSACMSGGLYACLKPTMNLTNHLWNAKQKIRGVQMFSCSTTTRNPYRY